MSQLSEEYKLFEVTTAKNDKQVIRYTLPNSQYQIEPLWTSNKRKLKPADVPNCPRCGSKRALEIQVMPMLYDFCSPLRFVDWESIFIYTCTNLAKCVPDFAKDEYYLQEFAYIQLSEDFEKVQYATEQQIIEAKKLMQQQQSMGIVQEESEDEENKEKELEKQRKKAEKNKLKRERQKEKAKATTQQVQQQVASEITDLMKDLKF